MPVLHPGGHEVPTLEHGGKTVQKVPLQFACHHARPQSVTEQHTHDEPNISNKVTLRYEWTSQAWHIRLTDVWSRLRTARTTATLYAPSRSLVLRSRCMATQNELKAHWEIMDCIKIADSMTRQPQARRHRFDSSMHQAQYSMLSGVQAAVCVLTRLYVS